MKPPTVTLQHMLDTYVAEHCHCGRYRVIALIFGALAVLPWTLLFVAAWRNRK